MKQLKTAAFDAWPVLHSSYFSVSSILNYGFCVGSYICKPRKLVLLTFLSDFSIQWIVAKINEKLERLLLSKLGLPDSEALRAACWGYAGWTLEYRTPTESGGEAESLCSTETVLSHTPNSQVIPCLPQLLCPESWAGIGWGKLSREHVTLAEAAEDSSQERSQLSTVDSQHPWQLRE